MISSKIKTAIQTKFNFQGLCYEISSTDPNEVAVVGLENGESITELIIPERVTFLGRSYLVTTIGDKVLRDYENLRSIVIPSSITSIKESLFLCFFHSIEVSEDNSVYSSVDGVLFNKEQTELICYPTSRKAKHYSIPNTVVQIADEAFSPCEDLSSIDIPNSVKHIGFAAFQGTGLERVQIPNSITSIGAEAFSYCDDLVHIEFPTSIVEISEGCCTNCNKMHSVVIPNGVIAIGQGAFSWCQSLRSIELPNSIKRIGERAFGYSRNLSDVKLSKSLETIEEVAFIGCKSLQRIDLPETLKSIGEYVFEESGLRGLKLPNSRCSIEYLAFSFCFRLNSIYIPPCIESISFDLSDCLALSRIDVSPEHPFYSSLDGVLFNKEQTELICYPQGLKHRTYTVPSSVRTIGRSFGKCRSLQTLNIPSSVSHIDKEAFIHCYNLKRICVDVENSYYSSTNGILFDKEQTALVCYPHKVGNVSYSIPNSVNSIEDSAFLDKKSLQEIILPPTLQRIEAYAFSRLRLTKIELPASLVYMEDCSFSECEELDSVVVYIRDLDKADIDPEAFQYLPKSCTLYVPKGMLEAYRSREPWKSSFAEIREVL